MNDKEKKTAEILLDAIDAIDSVENRLRAVNAYREFMCAVQCRVSTEEMLKQG